MQPKIIAFIGDRGCGKDAACDAMAVHGFRKLAFADPLREVCRTAFGLTTEEMGDRDLKEQRLDRFPFRSPRQILMTVGTEGFRDHFPGVWVEAFKRSASLPGGVAVPDCRFADEAQAIQELGGLLIRVHRPGVKTVDAHRSELEWQSFTFDGVLINDCRSAEEWKTKVVRTHQAWLAIAGEHH